MKAELYEAKDGCVALVISSGGHQLGKIQAKRLGIVKHKPKIRVERGFLDTFMHRKHTLVCIVTDSTLVVGDEMMRRGFGTDKISTVSFYAQLIINARR
jgi:hypothetical protein